MGDPQIDASLKTFTIDPDKAGIFIYRNEILALAVKMNVAVDGTPLGQTAAKTYLYTPVAPGKHIITSYAENTDSLEVDIKAGTQVYVWQEIKFGPNVKLHLMNDAVGKKGVLGTKLAQNFPATQDIEVLVAADNPVWQGPLECQAANSFGIWQFVAPGNVKVQTAITPLRITCTSPAGDVEDVNATVESPHKTPGESMHKGAAAGAGVGAATGAVLGAAATPVMGPAFAVGLVVGGALQGAELGGIVGAVSADDKIRYPSPITLHIKFTSTPK